MQGNPPARFPQLVCQPCVYPFPNTVYQYPFARNREAIKLCMYRGFDRQSPKAVAIEITPETSCVNFRMSSRSSGALPAHR
jgi:hypothetical protein